MIEINLFDPAALDLPRGARFCWRHG